MRACLSPSLKTSGDVEKTGDAKNAVFPGDRLLSCKSVRPEPSVFRPAPGREAIESGIPLFSAVYMRIFPQKVKNNFNRTRRKTFAFYSKCKQIKALLFHHSNSLETA
jgi:hypothetical protein